jgi:hypothetical protein
MRTKLIPEVMDSIRADREERGLTLSAIMERYELGGSTAFTAIAGLDDSKVGRSTSRSTGVSSTSGYTEDEVDFFLGYVPESDAVYVFPFDATRRFKTTLTVWILRQPMNRNGAAPFDPVPFRNAFHLLSP